MNPANDTARKRVQPTRFLWLALGILLLGVGLVAQAGQGERIRYRSVEFVAYWVDFQTEELDLFWRQTNGQPYGTLIRLRDHLAAQSRELKFAINAGIFARNDAPLGLHVEPAGEKRALNLGNLEGGQYNFYLKPNGVFYVAGRQPGLLESEQYARRKLRPELACQSGPLLLEQGRIHPAFRPNSTNLHWRSGVGVTRDARVVFAISNNPLCFYDFASLFQEKLGCDHALYLDGDICAIYLPELGYDGKEQRTTFTGMFGVIRKSNIPGKQ